MYVPGYCKPTKLTGLQPRPRARAWRSEVSSGLELCLGLLMSSSRRAAGSGSSSEAAQVRPARTSEQRSPLVSAGDVPSSAIAGAAYLLCSLMCCVLLLSRAYMRLLIVLVAVIAPGIVGVIILVLGFIFSALRLALRSAVLQ